MDGPTTQRKSEKQNKTERRARQEIGKDRDKSDVVGQKVRPTHGVYCWGLAGGRLGPRSRKDETTARATGQRALGRLGAAARLAVGGNLLFGPLCREALAGAHGLRVRLVGDCGLKLSASWDVLLGRIFLMYLHWPD